MWAPRHSELLLASFGFQMFLSENTFSLALSAWWCEAALLSVCVVVGRAEMGNRPALSSLQAAQGLACAASLALGCSWEGNSPTEPGAGGGGEGVDTSFPLSSSCWAHPHPGEVTSVHMVHWDRVTWKSATQIRGDRKCLGKKRLLASAGQRGRNCRPPT